MSLPGILIKATRAIYAATTIFARVRNVTKERFSAAPTYTAIGKPGGEEKVLFRRGLAAGRYLGCEVFLILYSALQVPA